MVDIRLEGEKMTDENAVHRHIAKRLDFSDDYGKNLDALWEELTDLDENMIITLYDTSSMLDHLGQFGYDLLDTFEDAARANHHIIFESIN